MAWAIKLSNGYVTDDVTWPPKVLWGSTVGYPSDSLASSQLYLASVHLNIFVVFRCITTESTIAVCSNLNIFPNISVTLHICEKYLWKTHFRPCVLWTSAICLGGAVVRALDFWSGGLGFDSPSARYQTPRSTQPSIPPGSVNRVPAFTGWG